MTDPTIRDQAVQLYDAFTHEHRDRRTLLRQMTVLAGSVAAAEAMILGIAASPAMAAQIDPADARLKADRWAGTIAGKPAAAYVVSPVKGARRRGTVIVIHENRGLTPHIQDVARRVALSGFDAAAVDFLAPQGGTPADEDAARDLIGKADYDVVIAQALGFAERYRTRRGGTGKVGMVGFCWGGGLVNRIAVAGGSAFAAGVAYYGPAPAPSEAVRVATPLMLHYAGKDARVAATGEPWVAALKAAGKPVAAFTYPNVDHAFNNDTSTERYDAAAAALAWGRTTTFFHQHLDA